MTKTPEATVATVFSSVMSQPVKAQAWTTEDGDLIVYGSNDPRQMQLAAIRYVIDDVGATPGEDEWPEGVNHREFFAGMTVYWTTPRDDETPFDKFTSWAPDRVPWAMADPYEYVPPSPIPEFKIKLAEGEVLATTDDRRFIDRSQA